MPAATSSLQVTGAPLELEEELLDDDEELEELEEDDELEAPLDDDEDDAPPELLEDELPGVIPPFVHPCRATAPAAKKMSAIFFI